MDQKAIFIYCKNLGCCQLCCLRYLGVRNPNAYENPKASCAKFEEENIEMSNNSVTNDPKDQEVSNGNDTDINTEAHNGEDHPPQKKRKIDICVSCLGILQEETWPSVLSAAKEVLDKKKYQCETFACALSSPIATILREKAVSLRLAEEFSTYDSNCLTPLKEAWKWSFGIKLAAHINKTLDSGAVSPLLVTITLDYIDELQELEILKTLSPELFEERSKQKQRFAAEFTRRSVEQALSSVSVSGLRGAGGALGRAGGAAHCAAVRAAHAPHYLAARYIKLSRELPQSHWILDGKRVLPSSVQEIIAAPIAKLYDIEEDEADRRIKFIAAGREDVDVRCLGDGRPFALEITDPPRQLTPEELSKACEEISQSGQVIVKRFAIISRDHLVQLKKGEETKSKTYEALCIKLSHSKYEQLPPEAPIQVTPSDISRINEYRNTPEGDAVKINIQQRTPIRVLHRRPLLTRTRQILELSAKEVPGHPQLFKIFVHTSAGTYVKEWVHGEFGRTTPSLGEAIGANVDLLALDVNAVHLDWPPITDKLDDNA